MEKKETFRFGVMGAGNISNKFCDAAEKTEEVCVTAVAARSEERAREFAEKYEIHTYYGNYEEMLQKEKLDGLYWCGYRNACAVDRIMYQIRDSGFV